MQHECGLLLGALYRDEPHCWPHDRLTNRLSICSAVFAAFYVGLHISWRHFMANREQLASPVVGRGTCFNANDTSRKIREK
jgi:hypothetical protein